MKICILGVRRTVPRRSKNRAAWKPLTVLLPSPEPLWSEPLEFIQK